MPERGAAIAVTGTFTPVLLMRIQTFHSRPDLRVRFGQIQGGKPDRLYRPGDFAR
jgi:hypothetical protein